MRIFLNFVPIIAAFVALYTAHLAGVWVLLGAHPFWSQSATQIGLLFGLASYFLVTPSPNWRVIILLLSLTGLGFFTSSEGKEVFVESYAENRFAGRIWYFGFIGFIAGLFTVLSALIGRLNSASFNR